MTDEHNTLLQAIGTALGLSGPYVETVGEREQSIHVGTGTSPPISASLEVLGGAVDPERGRVAWVEQRSEPPRDDGYVPVQIDLKFAWDGALRSVAKPYFYNPYFGCTVHLARWYQQRFVLLYREKHKLLLHVYDPPYEIEKQRRVLSDDFVVGNDTVWCVLNHGVVRGIALPNLNPGIAVLLRPGDTWPRLLFDADGTARTFDWPEVRNGDFVAFDNEIAARRSRATAFEMPPVVPRSQIQPDLLLRRWRALLEAQGIPANTAHAMAANLGEPWLKPEMETRWRFGPVLASVLSKDVIPALASQLERLAAMDPGRAGWPGLATLDENLDALFLWRTVREVQRVLTQK